MGKNRSKNKGSHYERKIVELHQNEGIVARKVPLSGALPDMPGDVTIADHFRGEVKARKKANGFKVARNWLGSNDLLFLQELETPPRGNPEPLVMMGWSTYLTFLKAWGQAKDQP